jgi:hypothetical protein
MGALPCAAGAEVEYGALAGADAGIAAGAGAGASAGAIAAATSCAPPARRSAAEAAKARATAVARNADDGSMVLRARFIPIANSGVRRAKWCEVVDHDSSSCVCSARQKKPRCCFDVSKVYVYDPRLSRSACPSPLLIYRL